MVCFLCALLAGHDACGLQGCYVQGCLEHILTELQMLRQQAQELQQDRRLHSGSEHADLQGTNPLKTRASTASFWLLLHSNHQNLQEACMAARSLSDLSLEKAQTVNERHTLRI